MLGDPLHSVDNREITVDTEAADFDVSVVAAAGAPGAGAVAVAPRVAWGAAAANLANNCTTKPCCPKGAGS